MAPRNDADGAEYYRRELYDVLSAPDRSRAEKRRRLLALGCEHLDVENAHVVEVDIESDRHEIVEAWGSELATAGTVSALQETFCRATIERDDVLSVSNVDEGGWRNDPAAERWDLGSYIGRKVAAGDELYGTVCLVDADGRDEPFSAVERSFVDLLGQAIGRLVEREDHAALRREHQDRSRLLVQEVDDYAIFRLDPAGFVASWNNGARSLKGYEEPEIVGEHFSTFYPADQRDEGRPGQLLERARRDGRVEVEGWRVRKDGSRFWALVTITALYDEDDELRGFGKVTRDLSERRSLREHLAAEKRFTERTLDTLDDLYFVLDADGHIERTNDRLGDVTGRSRTDLAGVPLAELFVPEDAAAVEEAVRAALETGEAAVEATLLTAAGERRRYELRGRSLADREDGSRKAVCIGRDITKRTRYEERLQVAQRALRHNLRNDLNVIHGLAETIRERHDGDPADVAESIERTAEELLALSEKTRTMAEIDGSRNQEDRAALGETLRRAVREVDEAHPGATIDVDPPSAEGLLVASSDLLRTAVENAVENAVEHHPDDDPRVEVEAALREGDAVVEVQDDCPPIPAEELRVLEDGESPLSHGSSMGLWLIQWATSALGGTVAFEDESDGNAVRLRVPVRRST